MASTQCKGVVDIRVPVDSEECTFHSWRVNYKKSHILHSKCSSDTGVCGDSTAEMCLYCKYNHELELPHMPDMVFPNNVMQLKHPTGCCIEFNALDALRRVSNGKLALKIACSEAWKESRAMSVSLEVVKPFDWTFTTDYKGTVSGNFTICTTESRIDMNKLRQKEKILFYNDLTLFEDELHDNGIAVCSVKIRVMPSSFFILLRYFLRVDNVLLRINDTRYYHECDTDFVLREYTSREAKVKDLNLFNNVARSPICVLCNDPAEMNEDHLKTCEALRSEETTVQKYWKARMLMASLPDVPPQYLIEPSEIAPILPLVDSCYEKLTLPSTTSETKQDSSKKA